MICAMREVQHNPAAAHAYTCALVFVRIVPGECVVSRSYPARDSNLPLPMRLCPTNQAKLRRRRVSFFSGWPCVTQQPAPADSLLCPTGAVCCDVHQAAQPACG